MPTPALALPNPGASQRTPRKRAGVRFAPALPGFAGCAGGDETGGGSCPETGGADGDGAGGGGVDEGGASWRGDGYGYLQGDK